MNPLGFAYSNVTGVPEFCKPDAIVVTGRGNRYDPAFQEGRRNGGKVYMYMNTLNCPVNLKNPQDQEQFLINGQPPPAWPFKTPDGKNRTNWPGTYLQDIRDGSPVRTQILNFAKDMIQKKMFDGFFLDTLGFRPWSHTRVENGVTIPGADFETWPAAEQQLWSASCMSIALDLHNLRVALQPEFELLDNNIWNKETEAANKYCNGVCFENNPHSDFHSTYAKKTFAGPPFPRRVFVISNTEEKFEAWKTDPNITHITKVIPPQTYAQLTPPAVPYDPELTPCEKQVLELTKQNEAQAAQIEELKGDLVAAEAENSGLRVRLAKINELSEAT